MILLTTIRQSGTNYMMNEIGRDKCVQRHCSQDVVASLGQYDKVITTYRSPLYVARSWAQRYNWPEVAQTWRDQWKAWRDIVDRGASVARVEDFRGPKVKVTPQGGIYHAMTKALNAGDFDAYYEHVPRELIDYAADLLPEGFDV